MANKTKDVELIEEKQALTAFFSSLLTDADNTVKELTVENEVSNTVYKNVSDVTSTVFLPEIPHTSPEPSNIKSTELDLNLPLEVVKNEQQDSQSDVTPSEVDEIIQIMMFKTAGLTLAVPLIELSGVITWPENITEMPGHSESYLGLVTHLGQKIPVIDIAQIVFPQERLNLLSDSKIRQKFKRIVFISDYEWGLACDEVNDVINLKNDQIKWRKSATKRPWLAGTVVDHMCALLDTKELSRLLKSDNS